MPQLQVVDFGPDPLSVALGRFGEGLGGRAVEKQMRGQEDDAVQRLVGKYKPGMSRTDFLRESMSERGIPLERRAAFFDALTQADESDRKKEEEQRSRGLKDKMSEQAAKDLDIPIDLAKLIGPEKLAELYKNRKQKISKQDSDDQFENLLKRGYSPEDAKAYVNGTDGVKQILERKYAEAEQRGQVTPESKKNVPPLKVEESEWPTIAKPEFRTPKEIVTWEEKNQRENNKYLADAKKQEKGAKDLEIHLNRLAQLNPKVVNGKGRILIDPKTGEPYPEAQLLGLVNKETQNYVKTLRDFLSGAKNFFGSRVTNFDVQSFMGRLPNLLNTPEGREVIIKQMKLLNDLEVLHSKGMADGLKHYGKNAPYSEVVRVVDDKISAQEEEIINKINLLDTASDYMDQMASNPKKFEGTTLMMKDGQFKAVPPEKMQRAKSQGWSVF